MPELINTATMPGDDMSPGQIEAAAADFRTVGTKVSDRGGTILTKWRKIDGIYDAPEETKLTRAMDPVKTTAEAIGTDLGAAAKALDTFAAEVRTIKAEVVKIRADAAALLGGITDGKITKTYYGGGDYYTEPFDWDTDQATVDANNALIRRTNDQQEALWAAERACAGAIRAAVGLGPVRARGAGDPKGYGSLEIPDDAAMPWGPTVERTESCLEHAGEGVVFDGAGGMLAGIGALGGVSYSREAGWDRNTPTAEAAWTGLVMFAAGAATIGPVALAGAHAVPGPVGNFLRNSQLAVAAGIGGLIAMDLYAKDPLHKWKSNSARAGGEVLFNVATFALGPLTLSKFGRVGRPNSDAADTPGSTGPADAQTNGPNLQAQLTGQEIAGGHAFQKHVIDKAEFPDVTTRSQFAAHIENVVRHGEMRALEKGRSAYWLNGTVVIRNPKAADGGTAFRPSGGYDYYLELD